MDRTFLKYLLSSTSPVVRFAPNDPPNGGDGGDDQNQGGDDQGGDDDLNLDENDLGDQGDDQGDDQDDDEGDDEDTDGDQGGAPQPERGARGNRQFSELRRTARETARQNAELTRQLAEMRGEMAAIRQQSVSPAETAQQRAERMALMSPEERAQEMVNDALARNRQETQQLTATLMDQSDRSSFEARCASNPLLRKLQNDVERELQGLRQRGERPLPREVIATYLLGQRVMAQQGKRNPGRQERRQQQRARPVNAGSNANSQRARRGGAPVTAQDYEDQFGDVSI